MTIRIELEDGYAIECPFEEDVKAGEVSSEEMEDTSHPIYGFLECFGQSDLFPSMLFSEYDIKKVIVITRP